MELKALVLAAGHGTRLKPLTNDTPKPFLPFFGPTIADFAIHRIQQAGINDIAINICHLHEISRRKLQHPFHSEIHVSHESTLLGTAGAVDGIRTWLGKSDLLIINGDVIADFNISNLVEKHYYAQKNQGAVATMAVLPLLVPQKNPIYVSQNQELTGISTPPKKENMDRACTFACAHIISREFIERVPKNEASEIIPIYQKFLEENRKITTVFHEGYWRDLGTPLDYWQAHQEVFTEFPSLNSRLGIQELRNKLNQKNDEFQIDHVQRVYAHQTKIETRKFFASVLLGPFTDENVLNGDQVQHDQLIGQNYQLHMVDQAMNK